MFAVALIIFQYSFITSASCPGDFRFNSFDFFLFPLISIKNLNLPVKLLSNVSLANEETLQVGIIPNFDRRIISLIHDVEFKYLERYISFAARPTKRIDSLIMKLAQRVL